MPDTKIDPGGHGRTMKPKSVFLHFAALCGAFFGWSNPGGAEQLSTPTASPRQHLLMDFGWKFHLGDAASAEGDFGFGLGGLFAKAGEGDGPARVQFNDTAWRSVDLPHDWAVDLGFVKSDNSWVTGHGFKPVGRAYPNTSVGWYRKWFIVPEADRGKRFALRFDGVFRDCVAWINGHYLGNSLSGYGEFGYEITDYVTAGSRNIVVVRVDASQYEGWFYEGAGMYRHVWLDTYSPLHIPDNGTYVRSEVDGDVATVLVEETVLNEGDDAVTYDLVLTIRDAGGKDLETVRMDRCMLPPHGKETHRRSLRMRNPLLWSPDTPHLYTLVADVIERQTPVDRRETVFGIRTVRFDKERGFLLNGKRVEIKGVCCHQDHAGVGSALPDRLQEYRIERLKLMGVNAYRTSHHPPARELLEACDRLGMLVLDENRLLGSSPELLGQFERLVLRDRNHPSVILWSLGNEEWFVQGTDPAKKIALTLLRRLRELDPGRTATYAANNGNQFDGINSIIPIRGINYLAVTDIDKYHRDHPEQPLLGTEEASTVCTRGVYADDPVRGYVSDHDINKPSWGTTAEQWWKFYVERPWLAGAFVWTGFDYRGEPTPYGWPCINSHFGIMDVCGFPKNNYYYYQAWWTTTPVLHLAPHWNWKGREGDTITVWCQSNAESVELFLNGESMGRKTMEKNSHLEWPVRYAPGTLEARGWRAGEVQVARQETTGDPVTIRLTPDRVKIAADGEDVCVIEANALDAKGRAVPAASNLLQFEVSGDARILGVGNGDPSSHEADKCADGMWQRSLFNGKCQVILRAGRQGGSVELRAISTGLEPAVVTIFAQPAAGRPRVQ